MTKVFHSFSDPGHGWVRVPVKELVRMDIAHKITPYSYLKGDIAFLEEDVDLTLFVERKREMNEEFTIQEYSSTERQSKIRSYCRYDVAEALEAYNQTSAALIAKKKAQKNAELAKSIEAKMVTRKNLMTGEYQEAADTPLHLSPASDTYWSM